MYTLYYNNSPILPHVVRAGSTNMLLECREQNDTLDEPQVSLSEIRDGSSPDQSSLQIARSGDTWPRTESSPYTTAAASNSSCSIVSVSNSAERYIVIKPAPQPPPQNLMQTVSFPLDSMQKFNEFECLLNNHNFYVKLRDYLFDLKNQRKLTFVGALNMTIVDDVLADISLGEMKRDFGLSYNVLQDALYEWSTTQTYDHILNKAISEAKWRIKARMTQNKSPAGIKAITMKRKIEEEAPQDNQLLHEKMIELEKLKTALSKWEMYGVYYRNLYDDLNGKYLQLCGDYERIKKREIIRDQQINRCLAATAALHQQLSELESLK